MTNDPDILADDWLKRASAKVSATTLGPHSEQIGRVEEVGDGIALVSGLPTVQLDELLRFDKGQFGFAQVLERGRVGCVIFDDVNTIQAGDRVRGTGDVVRVPVGPALLGRIVDPLGRPLDGKGPVATDMREPIERPAPAIIDRDLVDPARSNRPRSRRHPVRAWPRSTRTHYRRPRHRQDYDRDRHDHQSKDERHALRLRRSWPEEFQRPSCHRRNHRVRRS
jgi:hypothetical protein